MSLDHHMTSNYNKYTICARNILLQEGVLAFYKGFPITGITYPIYVGLQFLIYERLRKSDSSFFANSLVAGASAGLCAQSLMFPGDTIKRNLQINGIDNTKQKYTGLVKCIKFMYRTHGIKSFYAGYYINMIKAMPEVALQFTVYDLTKNMLNRYLK